MALFFNQDCKKCELIFACNLRLQNRLYTFAPRKQLKTKRKIWHTIIIITNTTIIMVIITIIITVR